MKKVFFYLLSPPIAGQTTDALLTDYEQLACQKIAAFWQQQKRILVACQTQQQAEKLDEYLWQLDAEHFIPHNLAGEGPRMGAPVELCWPQRRSNTPREILINLQYDYAPFMAIFNDIIDFVPTEETLKSLARTRYNAYKQAGFNLKTINVD